MKKNKRFLVFGFDKYYAQVGLDDVKESFETYQETSDYIDRDMREQSSNRFYQVYDTGEEMLIDNLVIKKGEKCYV